MGPIFVGTALPEEILFRSPIQNLLALRLGAGARTLLAASFIFGCAHFDNEPQALPNWRYLILATLAGAVLREGLREGLHGALVGGTAHVRGLDQHFFFRGAERGVGARARK